MKGEYFMNSAAEHQCNDCIYAKEYHMPEQVYCTKHNEFVERKRIPECYSCDYFCKGEAK